MRLLEVAVVPVLVALITATAALISNRAGERRSKVLREENSQQHAEGRQLVIHLSNQIGSLDGKVDRLDERLDLVQVWQVEHEIDHLRDNQP